MRRLVGGRVRPGLANKPSAISLNQSEMIKPLKTPGSLMSTLKIQSERPDPMPRYYFNFRWPDDAVTDTEGVELESFGDAYATARADHSALSREITAGS
jgi:hypothetical protein